MDALHFAIAFIPLAVYLLLVGLINLLPGPFVTSGARDITALGIALCGLAVIGPMELFHPEAAASRFHGWVWILLLIFYGLSVSLMMLLMRPRIVVYNTTEEQLMPVLRSLVSKLDKESRWAGDNASVPNLEVQFYVQAHSPLRNVQLVANGSRQSFEGWRQLEKELAAEVKQTRTSRSALGLGMIVCSLFLTGAAMTWLLNDQMGVLQALNEMLRK